MRQPGSGLTTSAAALCHDAAVPLAATLDVTPLLGARTGVGRYVDRLTVALSEIAANHPEKGLSLRGTAFTVRGAHGLPDLLPDGIDVVRRAVPARVLQSCWARSELPPVELLAGRCDVFHATNFVLPPTRRAAGVVTVHDLAFVRHPETVTAAVRRYQKLVPRSLRRARIVLCPAEATADAVAEYYRLDRSRVIATPLGVDQSWQSVEPIDEAARVRLALPERYVLFLGAREPRKGLPTLLAGHAFAQAADDRVPPLVLAGPAGWGDGVPPTKGVVLAGWLDDADLPRIVAGAQALLLMSVEEGFGLPLLEALACGTPVVASDLPVHREVAGPHGTYVPVGDADALAAALIAVAEQPRQRQAVEARRQWASGWTWERCALATLAAYEAAAE